jgi:hypothetical protein
MGRAATRSMQHEMKGFGSFQLRSAAEATQPLRRAAEPNACWPRSWPWLLLSGRGQSAREKACGASHNTDCAPKTELLDILLPCTPGAGT